MTIEKEIARLVQKSMEVSTIRFLPHSTPPPPRVVEINNALAHADSEEERWQLFLTLLQVWSRKRAPVLGKKLFGSCPLWTTANRSARLSLWEERSGFSIRHEQTVIVEVIGEVQLTTGYYLELRKRKLALTVAECYQQGRLART